MNEKNKIIVIDEMIKNLNEYRAALDDIDHTISIIMRQINKTRNLSKDEYDGYEQTLKYILKD